MKVYDPRVDQTVESAPWQDALKPGDYYLILNPFVGVLAGGEVKLAENLDIPIFGQLLDAEGYEPGFFFVCAYSWMCPDGENGLVCIIEIIRTLTPAEFEVARRANWLLE